MANIVTAISAYQAKAQAIAAILAPRIGGFYWDGYTVDEELEGAMIDDDTVRFWRPLKGNHDGHITFGFIKPVNASELSRKPPRIIKEGVKEYYAWDIDIKEGTTYDETLSHTFTETISEQRAWEQKWGVEVEAQIGYAPPYATGGITANLKATGSYGQDTTDTTGTVHTSTDTLSRHFQFSGPKKTRIVAQRSKNTEERTCVGKISNQAKLYFNNAASQYEWRDLDILESALRGLEPKNTDFTPFGGSSSLRQKMIEQPATKAELALIGEESDQQFEFVIQYDDITHQDISEVEQ